MTPRTDPLCLQDQLFSMVENLKIDLKLQKIIKTRISDPKHGVPTVSSGFGRFIINPPRKPPKTVRYGFRIIFQDGTHIQKSLFDPI